MNKSKTRDNSVSEWDAIKWRKLEIIVFKLQKRIFKASENNDVITVRKLQKTLLKSWAAKCLAVRKVTQENKGKNTAGVDGKKSVSPKRRLEMVDEIKLSSISMPTRRIWIPKPGKDEMRPLGIPTLSERAKQALVKLVLEPEWEAKFEPNSYGFRPGRSCHDAIEAVFKNIRLKPKYVLDADISKCFDKINHEELLVKVNAFPTLRTQLKAWLKSGFINEGELFSTDAGTPQGGVASPLMANIALHGLQSEILKGLTYKEKMHTSVIVYADDFVVLSDQLETIHKAKEAVTKWLNKLGLTLNPEKTRISHTLKSHNGNKGFQFLGFDIQQYVVGKYKSGKNTNGNLLGFKTIIKPSKEKVTLHLEKIKTIINVHKALPQELMIYRLNQVIKGWSNYYSTVVSAVTFKKLDHLVFLSLKSWAFRRHTNKGKRWAITKYWSSNGGNNWCFAGHKDDEKVSLIRHTDTPIVRHVKVQGHRSPFDGEWLYWSSRLGKYPGVSTKLSKLLKVQQGRCNKCGLYFTSENIIKLSHVCCPASKDKNNPQHWELVHNDYCMKY